MENSLPQDDSNHLPLSLEDLVDSAWGIIRPIAEERRVTLQLDRSESGLLFGDQRRLHRAVLNLLDNALRYSPDQSTVNVSIRQSGGWWLLSIRDHGVGLSESDLSRMFQRFYRGDPSRTRSNRSGSGLGLAIVQQIAVNHPAGGACMDLLLPREPLQ